MNASVQERRPEDLENFYPAPHSIPFDPLAGLLPEDFENFRRAHTWTIKWTRKIFTWLQHLIPVVPVGDV